MILKFTDDYENYIHQGYLKVADIITFLSYKGAYLGSDKVLDHYYALSIAITAICDHLDCPYNFDNELNESLLECLKNLISSNICDFDLKELKLSNTLPDKLDSNIFAKSRDFFILKNDPGILTITT